MARPRSEDKRNAILAAATKVFADKGLSASTASITNAAGLAEGTLFVYFKGKDELINTLYKEIKQDLADFLFAEYPSKGSLRARTKHFWDMYIDWGVENPDQLTLMHKLKVWEGLEPEVRESGKIRFAQLHTLIEGAIADGLFQNVPMDFLIAVLSVQVETTLQFMRHDAAQADLYKEKGFEIFWNGITTKKT
jgi:AcrR family transcriptional regulator